MKQQKEIWEKTKYIWKSIIWLNKKEKTILKDDFRSTDLNHPEKKNCYLYISY
jgi:hypothetical protein